MNLIKPKKFNIADDNAAVIDCLKEALAQALEGNITSVAVIACMPKGYAHAMAGRQASDLFMGAGSLQQAILAKTAAAGAAMVQDAS